MSILNVDKIQPIGSGSTVTVNATDTILTNAQAGVITATTFSGNLTGTINTAAQGNITSLGTLSGLVIDNNANTSMSSGSAGQLVVGGDGYTGAIALDADAMHIYHNSSSRAMVFGTDETERLRITGAGKVGVGIASPVGTFEIRDSKANLIVAKDGLTVKGNNDIHTTYDLIQLGAGGGLASYSTATATADTHLVHNAYRHSGGAWQYRYADTAMRLRMNSPGGAFIFDSAASGSAGATISFSEKLRITSTGIIQCGTSGTLKAEINNAVSGHKFISQCSDNNNGFEIYQQHGSTATRNTLAVYDNRGNSASKQLAFAVIGNGNVSIGDGNLVVANGKGIDFSATPNPTNGSSTSELFDYYEEGTFTPAFGGLSSVSYSIQFGRYTRIGRQVFCTATIDATGIDEASNITLTGLPYSATETSDNQQRSTWLLAYGGHITGVSDATARFRSAGSSWQGVKGTASTSYLTGQQLSSSGTINITGSFSYYVA